VTEDAEHHAQGAGGGQVQRRDRVRGHPGEERARLVGLPAPGDPRGRLQSSEPEPGRADRVARDRDDRSEKVADEVVGPLDERLVQTAPGVAVRAQSVRRAVDVSVHDAGPPVAEGMRRLDVGPAPGQPMLLELQAVHER
jgi:hypothetical protein